MENRHQKKKRKINPIANGDDVEVELPVEIIQRIQTSMIQSSESKFRAEKEAARTSLVSKSWHRACYTRLDLVFDRCYFRSGDDLWEFAKTTMKRYEDLNLNIRSLRLVMMNDVSLAKKLIVKAIKLGVVDLTIQLLETVKMHTRLLLPVELLQSQTLARLNLSGSFTVDLSALRREKMEVTCSNLKSLKLEDVTVIDGDLFRELISRCPSIEEFTLDSVYDTTSTSRNLMDREFDKLRHYFPKLKYLSLDVECALPRHVLWDQFSCLKELKISYQGYGDDLRIRIPSLERISLTLSHLCSDRSVEFDFPNIRKFKLKGYLPRLFELKTSTARGDQWESKIDIEYELRSDEWFSRLSQFVRMLNVSRSRVSLYISIDVDIQYAHEDEFRYFGDGLAIPAVEKLKLSGHQTVTPAFWDALFWSCRPKFVEIQNQRLYLTE